MTIDETINRLYAEANQESVQVADWLEELKVLRVELSAFGKEYDLKKAYNDGFENGKNKAFKACQKVLSNGCGTLDCERCIYQVLNTDYCASAFAGEMLGKLLKEQLEE